MRPARLLVDVGNSRIKWVLATDSGWTPGVPFLTHERPLVSALDRHWSKLERPAAVAVSNVAGPEIAEHIDHWVGKHWNIPVHYAQSERWRGPVVNGYTRPEQLGVDRWLGLLALQASYSLPACLVDCGTAITLDVLDDHARHCGGLIAPGLMTMQRSLQLETHAISPLECQEKTGLLGRDTQSCIELGTLMACAGLVEKTLVNLGRHFNLPMQLVLTGGDALRLRDYLTVPSQLCEDMVLRGLNAWFSEA